MPSGYFLSALALLASSVHSVSAATCSVIGGTADDGPAIKNALASCNNGGTVILDRTYTIGSVLQTNDLVNVAIQFTGTIKLSPGMRFNVLCCTAVREYCCTLTMDQKYRTGRPTVCN